MEPQNQNNLNNQANTNGQPNQGASAAQDNTNTPAQPAPFQTAGQAAAKQPEVPAADSGNAVSDQPAPATTFTPDQGADTSQPVSVPVRNDSPAQPAAPQQPVVPAETQAPASIPQPPKAPAESDAPVQPAVSANPVQANTPAAAPAQTSPQQQAPAKSNKLQNIKDKLNGPDKSTTVKIIAGLVALSVLGVLASFALGALAKDSVVAQFDELKTYQDDSGYSVQVPVSWQVKDGSSTDTFAVDPEDQTSNVGMNIIDSGTIPGYSSMSDEDKNKITVDNISGVENSLLESFGQLGAAELVSSSTEIFSDNDRTMYVEIKATLDGVDYRIANVMMIFADGSAYTMNVVVPDTVWGSVEGKVKDIFNGFKLA